MQSQEENYFPVSHIATRGILLEFTKSCQVARILISKIIPGWYTQESKKHNTNNPYSVCVGSKKRDNSSVREPPCRQFGYRAVSRGLETAHFALSLSQYLWRNNANSLLAARRLSMRQYRTEKQLKSESRSGPRDNFYRAQKNKTERGKRLINKGMSASR